MPMKGYTAFPKCRHYWILTVRLFNVIYRTLVGGVLCLCWDAVRIFCSPNRLGHLYGGFTSLQRCNRFILHPQPTGQHLLFCCFIYFCFNIIGYYGVIIIVFIIIRVVVGEVTLVEGYPKAPSSIATTPRCWGGRYSFPRLLHFTLGAYQIMLSVKQGGIRYHFLKSLVWLDLGLNPSLLDHWRTLYWLGQWPRSH